MLCDFVGGMAWAQLYKISMEKKRTSVVIAQIRVQSLVVCKGFVKGRLTSKEGLGKGSEGNCVNIVKCKCHKKYTKDYF